MNLQYNEEDTAMSCEEIPSINNIILSTINDCHYNQNQILYYNNLSEQQSYHNYHHQNQIIQLSNFEQYQNCLNHSSSFIEEERFCTPPNLKTSISLLEEFNNNNNLLMNYPMQNISNQNQNNNLLLSSQTTSYGNQH